ncbi:unnamed protein product [Dibothriocephalus latus]|uniref:RRM domain-containing protein n=1 Tax=Dibothriocephalus latus TaxID=60516 RepID=A0A3P7NAF9_DIBLA|nr:unnamed protein product [Dibothriocephalus latus]
MPPVPPNDESYFVILCSSPQGQASISAYITYYRPDDAMRAVLTLDQSILHGRQLRVSLGTTKYCSQFLKGQKCSKHVSVTPLPSAPKTFEAFACLVSWTVAR